MSATISNSTARNKHFRSSNRQSDEPIDITKEEFDRISHALKNEEFRKLFFEYCEEIQDPANRKRYEEEIIQFEAERGVEVKFINPEPGFVIKTSVDGAKKCFVNVAKSAEVEKPTNEVSFNAESGTRGLNWSIPLAQTGPREDLDANGKQCRVYDVVFHPDALYLAQKNHAFHKCLVDTALDAVEREYKVNLDRTNLKFPKLQFKGVARPTVIRKLAKNAPEEATEPHPLDHIYPAKPSADDAEPKRLPLKTKPTEKPEFTTPKYTIKHRRDVDLTEFTNELDSKLNVTVPRELVIEIELPLLKTTADCQLDVTTKSLYLLSEKTGAKYRLTLDLPYAVDDKMGNARFDSDLRRLSVTLPVIQQSTDQQLNMHNMLLHREDSGVESDVRDELNSNSESPIEELSNTTEDNTAESKEEIIQSMDNAANIIAADMTGTFLKSSIHYQFPAKFDCNVLDNVISLVLHVRNVQPESIATLKTDQNMHMQFISIGAGYYPTHYAFYLQLPKETNFKIESTVAEAWENNVVLNLILETTTENLHSYLAGLDGNDLKEYNVQGKFQVLHGSRQRKKSPTIPQISFSSSLDISVERSDCEKSIEIEIKPRELQSTCAANTTEDEETHQLQNKKMNKKQKKKNKKRRSLSETAYDDIKAYHKNQQELIKHSNTNTLKSECLDPATEEHNKICDNAADMPVMSPKVTASMTVPSAQQRKQRSYSECRDSVISSGGPQSFKGILKHYSRYAPRPSVSDSCSSIDDCSAFSCSVDAGVSSSLRFSQSFSDIPEENVNSELSESCKKTVRFNEVIKKQIFRLDSSILGQRKKNQKRRNQKQRALQRRLSEGDSADYEDIKPVSSEVNAGQYLKDNEHHKNNCKKSSQHDSGLDLSNCKDNNNKKKTNKNLRPRLESESSSDFDINKNSMMFEMDM